MNPTITRQTLKNSTGRWLIAMVMTSALLFTACASLGGRNRSKSELVVITDQRVVKPLENGNYEVTPAWLQERYEYEAWITEQLEKESTCPREPEK